MCAAELLLYSRRLQSTFARKNTGQEAIEENTEIACVGDGIAFTIRKHLDKATFAEVTARADAMQAQNQMLSESSQRFQHFTPKRKARENECSTA